MKTLSALRRRSTLFGVLRLGLAGLLLTLPAALARPVREAAAPLQSSPETDPRALFQQANEAYERGDFPRAESLYRDVIADASWSAAAHVNLGSALYRQGRKGAALQHYLSALRRAPRDALARHNAAVVAAQLGADLPEPERIVAAPLEPPLRWLSPGELASVAVLAVYLAAGLAALALLSRGRHRLTAWSSILILVAVVAAAAAFAGAGARAWRLRHEALTLTPGAVARRGPSPAEPAVLTLPEGTALRVGPSRPGWLFVSLPNGLSGWLPRADVGLID